MARKGRPRKPGRREGNRPPRLVTPHDKGNPRVAAMRERFGEHYNSAIGRAYASGLLGEHDVAIVRYHVGKRFQRAVERFFTVGAIRCTLGAERLSGGLKTQIRAHPFEQEEWRWLCDITDKLDQAGLRPWLDQLTLGLYHDTGPYWLDAMLDGGRHPADLAVLDVAIKALDLIAPDVPMATIRVVRA